MKNHITNVVNHYKGKCYAWDVVNEGSSSIYQSIVLPKLTSLNIALNEDGTYRNSIFYQTIGPAYIPIAFATAAAADPSVKLYYNDYNIENSGAKATAAQNIVKMIKAYGAKVDGVGLQGHFVLGSTPSQSALTSVLKGYTALGVEVAYTELDIRMQLPSTDAKLAQQATEYQNVAAACVGTPGCVGVTIWDWTDKYSWVPSVFQGYGAALPWDENYVKKPAYNGILAGLGASGSTTTTTLTTTTKTSTPTSTGVAQKWGQCGGNGWTGPTTCVSGTTCQKLNDWYSQCL
jgi:endo-1,4-beta-xylanase